MRIALVVLAVSFALGCGSVADAGDEADAGAGGDAGADDDAPVGPRDASSETRLDASTPDAASCAELARALGAELGGVKACTTTVRLKMTTLEPLGFDVACGPYAGGDEAAAAAAAEAATGFGADARQVAGAHPADAWIFVETPSDFGGIAVVSARTGLPVFGGGVVWGGRGEITHPKSWRPPSALGLGCGEATRVPLPTMRAFNLAGETTPAPRGATDALAVAWATALPDAIAPVGYVFDAVVLAYPRTAGADDPESAEWVVFVDSGWLE